MAINEPKFLNLEDSAKYLGLKRAGLYAMRKKYKTIKEPDKIDGIGKVYDEQYLAIVKDRMSRHGSNSHLKDLNQDSLRILLHYDPESGHFTWLERSREFFKSDTSWKVWNTRFKGKRAGVVHTIKSKRYSRIIICIMGAKYYAHRLAYIYMTGSYPEQIDHENRDATDNRWENLRDGTEINNRNLSLKKNNTSGVCGVSWSSMHKKWQAAFTLNSKPQHVGLFDDIKVAEAAIKLARAMHGYDPGHGTPKK